MKKWYVLMKWNKTIIFSSPFVTVGSCCSKAGDETRSNTGIPFDAELRVDFRMELRGVLPANGSFREGTGLSLTSSSERRLSLKILLGLLASFSWQLVFSNSSSELPDEELWNNSSVKESSSDKQITDCGDGKRRVKEGQSSSLSADRNGQITLC